MSQHNNQNRPQQQPNRPQQTNRPPQTHQLPTPASLPEEKTVNTSIQSSVNNMSIEAESFNLEEEITHENFEDTLTRVISGMLHGTLGSRDAKVEMLQWLTDNPEYTREQANEVINTLRGAVETVVQEIPRMLLR